MPAPHSTAAPPPSGEPWRFRCPVCGGPALARGASLTCQVEQRHLHGTDGVLPLMRAEQIAEREAFLDAYRRVRRNEGWGGNAAYYRTLPFVSDGPHKDVWRLRARSFRAALAVVDAHFPDAKHSDECDRTALSILEIGAGSAWFSWKLATRGHYVLATDISLDDEDGLGALARYANTAPGLERRLRAARAEMENLSIADAQFDVVVANGALHYARSVARAVAEAHRVLRGGGIFLTLDSPVYDSHESGAAMVRRRRRDHLERFGVDDDATTAGYLVARDFHGALERNGFRVGIRQPFEGLARRVRRYYCAVRRLDPPARFPLFVAEKTGW